MNPTQPEALVDYFAAAALQGMLASAECRDLTPAEYARLAYQYATEMFRERYEQGIGE